MDKIDKIEDYLCTALSLIDDYKKYYIAGSESDLYIIEKVEKGINNALDTLLYEDEENES